MKTFLTLLLITFTISYATLPLLLDWLCITTGFQTSVLLVITLLSSPLISIPFSIRIDSYIANRDSAEDEWRN